MIENLKIKIERLNHFAIRTGNCDKCISCDEEREILENQEIRKRLEERIGQLGEDTSEEETCNCYECELRIELQEILRGKT